MLCGCWLAEGGDRGPVTEGVSDTRAPRRRSGGWGGWPQGGKRGRNPGNRGRPTQVLGPLTTFLAPGFRTMVSVVAGFQNLKTENEGR